MVTSNTRGPALLRAWLDKRDMTNKEFAELIGAAASNVGRWLAGDWKPSFVAITAIEGATGIPGSAWLDERKPERKTSRSRNAA